MENEINICAGQIVAYYPFKFENIYTNENINSNKKIESKVINNINYDTYVKYVDEKLNEDNNPFSRTLLSIGVLNSEQLKLIQKPNEFPIVSQNNLKNDYYTNFVKVINDTLEKARKDENGNLIVSEEEKWKPIVSKINVILYKQSKIGFVEIFVNYAFSKDDDPEEMARVMNIDGGSLKKILFVNDNAKKIVDKSSSEQNNLINIFNNNVKAFNEFINNIDLLQGKIKFDAITDVLFNCREIKKRAYSFCYLAIPLDTYESYHFHTSNTSKYSDKFYKMLHYIGRCHGETSIRNFNQKNVEPFIHVDDTTCTWCITKVSFGTIFSYAKDKAYVYTVTALDEQHVFLYEMCLHQRFYLYSVIEKYRDDQNYGSYHKLKSEFASITTRYNLSLVSEVETQELYEKIRYQFDIKRVEEDANEALEKILVKNNSDKAITEKKFRILISILASIIAIKSAIPWDNFYVDIFFLTAAVILAFISIISAIRENTFGNKKNKLH